MRFGQNFYASRARGLAIAVGTMLCIGLLGLILQHIVPSTAPTSRVAAAVVSHSLPAGPTSPDVAPAVADQGGPAAAVDEAPTRSSRHRAHSSPSWVAAEGPAAAM